MNTLRLASIVTLLFTATARGEHRDVTFTAADGFVLQGTFHSAEKGGPGILLLHQCNADRRIYDQLAAMLNTAGYNVLAFDFRGFGGSRAGAYTDFSTSQPTVNNRALGVVGGSCGVNQAVQASRRHPEI